MLPAAPSQQLSSRNEVPIVPTTCPAKNASSRRNLSDAARTQSATELHQERANDMLRGTSLVEGHGINEVADLIVHANLWCAMQARYFNAHDV